MATEPELEEMDPTPLDAPDVIGPWLAEEVPELNPTLRRVGELIRPFVSFAHVSTVDAAATVINQATNDFIDTLVDCSLGRGRSALRSARSLFELAITAKEIQASPDLARRYMDHRYVVAQIESQLTVEAEHLPKRERSAVLHRRRKLARDTNEAYERAIQRYGTGFNRQWSPDDLRTRARRYGLDEEYMFFQLASAVLHGSAGGTLGLLAEIKDRKVHRVGPALSLCPLALLYALRLYRILLDTYGEDIAGPVADDLRGAIRDLVKLWPKYRRAVLRLDRQLWPDAPPPPHLAILAFKGSGRYRRWYLHDVQAGRIREARPPSHINPEQKRAMQYLIRRASEEADPSELITLAMLGVKVAPKPKTPWLPDSAILPRRRDDWRPKEIAIPEDI